MGRLARVACIALATCWSWSSVASASSTDTTTDTTTGTTTDTTTDVATDAPPATATTDLSDETDVTGTTAPELDEEPADPVRSGPGVALDRTEVRLGEPLIVTLTGFTSQQATVSVCGNLAKRGSEDCNMPQAQSERIRPDEPETLTQIFVQEPPVACPCIVRALGTNGEFAIAPLDIVDHPIEPIVSPALGPLVEVDVVAERVPANLSGRIRTGLGAATTHSVTVEVRNITTEALGNVVVRGRVSHRLSDNVVPLTFDVPGPIEPGQTWAQTIEVRLPAPYIGTYTWSVAAAGAGPTVDATTTTDAVPAILFTLLAVLALDVIVILVRAVLRRRRRRAAARRRKAAASVEVDAEAVEREPVGVG